MVGSENLPRREKREAERRKAHLGSVTAAACFPDRRKTEAHGNAFRRSVTAFFKTPVRSSGDLAHGDFAPLPVPVQPHQWQGPVVSPDGNPRPPDDVSYVSPRPQAPLPPPRSKASQVTLPQARMR